MPMIAAGSSINFLAQIHKIKDGVSTISYEARLEARLNVQMWNIQDERLPRAETVAPELPAPDTERWTPRRKASVVQAVLSGVMGLEEICHRYGLSVEEFRSWNNAMHRHGMRGLYITKLQRYRYFPTPSPNGTAIAVGRFGGPT